MWLMDKTEPPVIEGSYRVGERSGPEPVFNPSAKAGPVLVLMLVAIRIMAAIFPIH